MESNKLLDEYIEQANKESVNEGLKTMATILAKYYGYLLSMGFPRCDALSLVIAYQNFLLGLSLYAK